MFDCCGGSSQSSGSAYSNRLGPSAAKKIRIAVVSLDGMASGNVEIAGNGSGSRSDATDVQRRQNNRLSMVVEHSTGPSMIIVNVSTVTSVVITQFFG